MGWRNQADAPDVAVDSAHDMCSVRDVTTGRLLQITRQQELF